MYLIASYEKYPEIKEQIFGNLLGVLNLKSSIIFSIKNLGLSKSTELRDYCLNLNPNLKIKSVSLVAANPNCDGHFEMPSNEKAAMPPPRGTS